MKKGFSELLLLDVNVLLALAWPNHQFHTAATRRLEAGKGRWATCALTELGFVRLSSNASIVRVSKSPFEAAMLLAAMVKDARHVYLQSLSSPVAEPFLRSLKEIMSYKQVTDSYLIQLALKNRAILLTFDSRVQAFSHSSGAVEVLT